jgi:hypothetical protein
MRARATDMPVIDLVLAIEMIRHLPSSLYLRHYGPARCDVNSLSCWPAHLLDQLDRGLNRLDVVFPHICLPVTLACHGHETVDAPESI